MACKILAGNFQINSKSCDECRYYLASPQWKDSLASFTPNNSHSFCPFNGNANILTLYRTPGRIFENSAGALSVKSIYQGSEQYEIKGEKLDLRDNSYLIVNETARYVSSIEEGSDVETFCLSFGKDFMREAVASFVSSVDNALMDGKDESFHPELPDFLPMVNYSDEFMTSRMKELKDYVASKTPDGWFEDICLSILMHIMELHRKINFKIDNIPAVKKSTRIEIFKRLNLSKNYVKNNFDSDIDLEAMAETAYLSKYRFLRYFKQAFGITPHQFINQYRLEKAKNLILSSKKSITEISYEVGFKSPNHFSRLFLNQFGFSPNILRK